MTAPPDYALADFDRATIAIRSLVRRFETRGAPAPVLILDLVTFAAVRELAGAASPIPLPRDEFEYFGVIIRRGGRPA